MQTRRENLKSPTFPVGLAASECIRSFFNKKQKNRKFLLQIKKRWIKLFI